jgi:hypothetical protein
MIVSELAAISFFSHPLYQTSSSTSFFTHEMCSARHPNFVVLSTEPPYPQESANFTK